VREIGGAIQGRTCYDSLEILSLEIKENNYTRPQSRYSRITLDCQVNTHENHCNHRKNPVNNQENGDSQANRYIVADTFQCHVGTAFDAHVDQIEAEKGSRLVQNNETQDHVKQVMVFWIRINP